MSKRNELELNDDDKAVLRSSRTPELVKELMARRADTFGAEVATYRKLAAGFAAEADMLIAARVLKQEHDELVSAAEWKAEAELRQRKIDAIEARATELERVSAEKDAHVLRLTAGPAMAVSGD